MHLGKAKEYVFLGDTREDERMDGDDAVSEAEGRKSRQDTLHDLDLSRKGGSNLPQESWSSLSPTSFHSFPAQPPPLVFTWRKKPQMVVSHPSWTVLCKWGSKLLSNKEREGKYVKTDGPRKASGS